jgi:tRNA modification GTPase
MLVSTDTIYALSSGRPPAAIAVVRISGPRAGEGVKALIGRVPEPRKATLARVRDPQSGEAIDEALVLFFRAPHSETGEDVAELQLHGGRAVIAGTLAALSRVEGLRPAEPGEFTRRAFENGKLDLTEVEGLADLIYAETEAQRRQAYRQLRGLLGAHAESWRTQIVEAQALVEAGIDFSDEGDVPGDLVRPALERARALHGEIETALAQSARGERLRDGLVVAIAGPPNAGKSTLLNRIARREAAIVSPIAGTTRDVIEVHLDLDGYPVTLLDTAGIRDTDDPVEMEGVARARARAAEADLVLWVAEATAPLSPPLIPPLSPPPQGGREIDAGATWLVVNKIDLVEEGKRSLDEHGEREVNAGTTRRFAISATRGEGLDALISALAAHAAGFFGAAEPALVTRERQRRTLAEARDALARALAEGAQGREDILAEELRLAARALGRLTGRVDVEDILDVIFRDFCIGK